jgi:uncharacterized membrane protein YdcZ (DUF606 family)
MTSRTYYAEVVMIAGGVIALIVGAAIAVQVRLLGQVSLHAGPHVVGLLVSVASVATALLAVTFAQDWSSVRQIAGRPDWIAAGTLGLIAIAGLGAASARAGIVVTLIGSIIGQLTVGALLDKIR